MWKGHINCQKCVSFLLSRRIDAFTEIKYTTIKNMTRIANYNHIRMLSNIHVWLRRWFKGVIVSHNNYSHIPYSTMHHPEQKCVYFCSDWRIVGWGKGALLDSWICSSTPRKSFIMNIYTDDAWYRWILTLMMPVMWQYLHWWCQSWCNTYTDDASLVEQFYTGVFLVDVHLVEDIPNHGVLVSHQPEAGQIHVIVPEVLHVYGLQVL